MNDPQTPSPPFGDLDLVALGRLRALPAAFLDGRHTDLLAPLRHLPPGTLPSGPPPAVERRALAAGLAAANRAYGHPAADELAAKLADPHTRVVVTGQQPGLFGGPLLTLSKAIAAARWAAAIEAAGESAVAVFWVATEDHDWAEVSTAAVPTPGELASCDLGPDPSPLLPVGARSFGPGVEAALARFSELPNGPSNTAFWQQVASWYRPSARFGEAFPRLMVHLLGARAPLFLDAQLPELKAAERPHLLRLIRERAALEAAYRAADSRIEARGFALQVAPQPGLSPLFALDAGARRRIEWRGEEAWTLRGGDGRERPVADLLALVEDNPLVVSPGVLARPAIQDAVLGTTLQVMGPGEIAYMAQVAAAYPLLGITAPWTTLRPQVAIVEERHLTWLSQLGLELAHLLGDPAEVDRRLAARQGLATTDDLGAELERRLAALREQALAIDPGLETPYRKTRETIERALTTFNEKLTAAAARADETARRRLEQLRAHLLPGGKLQERIVTTAHYPARYGLEVVDAIWEQMALDPRRLQVVRV